MDVHQTDVAIAGGGLVGRALAVALARSEPGLGVLLTTGGAPPVAESDDRWSAIAAAGRRMFERLGLWQDLAEDAYPIREMVITDSDLRDVVRPPVLEFEGEVGEREPFAHMVSNQALGAVLSAAVGRAGVTVSTASARSFDAAPDRVDVHLSDGGTVGASLLVAADGARSRLRDLAGIGTVGRSYPQKGIVTRVAFEEPNDARAIQHFLPSGPFAILPIADREASIVWTEDADTADRMIALDDLSFLVELERRFGTELGEVTLTGRRHAFPLALRIARSYVAPRFALLGDAAHVIHPLAGQGLNLGLRDVAALAETVVTSHRLGLEAGSDHALRDYERLRRGDVLRLGLVTDALNLLFSNRMDWLRTVRSFGLGAVDRAAGLKRILMMEAAGLAGDGPRLLKGEAI